MEGYKNYKEVEVETASGLKLVTMLYVGAIKFLNMAKEGIKNKKLDLANNNIIKAQDIITELMSSLNFDAGEIAHNLYSLYIYMNRRLLESNIEKNIEIINQTLERLKSFLETASSEFSKFARKEDLSILAKQAKMFQPLDFVRKKDIKEIIKEVIKLLETLKGAWDELLKTQGGQSSKKQKAGLNISG